MAVFSGTIAYTLNNLGQKTIELSEAALFAYIYPIFSAILAVVLLQEKLTPVAVIGSVITFAGVLLAEIKKKSYTS
jgi:drug/metabolite transporter (DMT)-like permease